MSPSQEVLISIENRLHELEQEIAALKSARSELQATATPPPPKRNPRRRRRTGPGSSGEVASAMPQLTEEEWLARREAELAAQSRAAAA